MKRNEAGRWKVAALAIVLDLLAGEPPARWHPVVWMGRLVERLERGAPRDGPARQLAYGGVAEVLCVAAAVLPAWLLERLVRHNSVGGALLLAAALKPTLAVRALYGHVAEVQAALEEGDLGAARRAVGRIVSRDVENLDEGGIAAAAVESLAENAADSVVAPLLYYAAFGLPGAYLYRMANTMDAMVGYRGRYEYLGKVAARMDDGLNLLPSRLSALATVAAGWLAGGSGARAWRGALRDSSRTASPNAGWPMAAVAGALDLRLEKVDHYVLNPEGRPPQARDLPTARKLVGASLTAALLGIILMAGRRSRGDRR